MKSHRLHAVLAVICAVGLAACSDNNGNSSPLDVIARAVAPAQQNVTRNPNTPTVPEGTSIDFTGDVVEQGDDGISSAIWTFPAPANPLTLVVCDDALGAPNECAPIAGDALNGNFQADAVGIVFEDDLGPDFADLDSCDESVVPLCTNTQVAIEITNVAPTVVAGANQSVNEGQMVSLNPSTFTDPSVLDTHTATVDWGDTSPVDVCSVSINCSLTQGAGSGTVDGNHVYADNGLFTVTVTVTDDDGGVGMDTFTVTVGNAVPTVNAGADQTVLEGDLVTIASTFNDPGTLDTHDGTVTINWGDGSPIDTCTGANCTVTEVPFGPPGSTSGLAGNVDGTHVYADNGAYTVTVTVTDDDGGSGSDQLVVTVNNAAPTVVAGNDQSVNEGITINLDPSTFNDPGTLDTHTATIDWGDGSTTVAGVVTEVPFGPPGDVLGLDGTVDSSHTYGDNGVFTVTVTVTDDEGLSGNGTFTVTVGNVAPTLNAGADQTGAAAVLEGDLVSLDPATFNDPGSQDTHTAVVDWGDGTSDDCTLSLNCTVTTATSGPPGDPAGADGTVAGNHVYADDGTYTVTITLTDDDGGVAMDSFDVDITNDVPTVIAGADQTVFEGDVVSLDPATFNDPGTLDTHVTAPGGTVTIDWGDLTPVDDCSVSANCAVTETPFGPPGDVGGLDGLVTGTHIYTDDGIFTVTITVTDDDGGSAQDTFVVTVQNALPVVNAGADQATNEGTEIFLDPATFTDASIDDTHTADVDWGDGTSDDCSLAINCSLTQGAGSGSVDGSHTYADEGTYTVTVTVTDDEGGVGSGTFDVVVGNENPTVVAGADQTVDEGVAVLTLSTFNDLGTADTHLGGAGLGTVTIDWGDGSPLDDCTITANCTVVEAPFGPPGDPAGANGSVAGTHVYADDGNYTVTVTVIDDDGGSGSSALTVTVNNDVPTLVAGNDQTVLEGDIVNLDPATFNDPGTLDTHTAVITWGDGTSDICTVSVNCAVTDNTFGPPGSVAGANGDVAGNHVYHDDGLYTVTITLTDDDGGVAVDTFDVTVNNAAPTVDGGGDRVADEGDLVNLGATFNDPGTGDTHTATIDWGDGTLADVGTVTETPSGPPGSATGLDGDVDGTHVYADDGTYTVIVTVTDDDGGVGVDQFDVTISNAPPVLAAVPDTAIQEGDTLNLSTLFNDPGTLDTHTGTVDWGDGVVDPLVVTEAPFGPPGDVAGLDGQVDASHQYNDNVGLGDHTNTVTVTLTDDNGGQHVITFDVDITDNVPSFDAGPTSSNLPSVVEGTPSAYTAMVSAAASDLIIRCTWIWGDGNLNENDPACAAPTMAASLNLPHTFTDNSPAGTFTVTLELEDEDGTVTNTVVQLVSNENPSAVLQANNSPHPEGQFTALTINWTDPSLDLDGINPLLADTYAVHIHWGDGTVDTVTSLENDQNISASHVYANDGTFFVDVEVCDDDEPDSNPLDSNFETCGSLTGIQIDVTPIPLNIIAVTTNAPVPEGSPATVWVVVEDTGGATLEYTFDFSGGDQFPPGGDGDFYNEPEDFGPITQSFSSFTLDDNDPGRTVRVRVVDPSGPTTAESSVVVVWTNEIPIVNAGVNQTINEGDPLTFTAGFTDAGANDTHSCTWNFGDGTPVYTDAACVSGVSTTPAHPYGFNGNYTVRLTVTDDDGGVGSDTLTVTVNDIGPNITSVSADQVNEGNPTTITTVATDPANDPLVYHYDLDFNGVFERIEAGPTAAVITHTFPSAGNFPIRVKVVDDSLNEAVNATEIVIVDNVAPVGVNVLESTTNANEGDTITFTGEFTDPGTHTCDWDFGDFGTASVPCSDGDTIQHTYTDELGPFTVSLTVTDTGALTGSATSANITIANVAPTVNAPNQTGNEGTPVTFTATFSDPGADTLTCTWDFGDASPLVTINSCTSPLSTDHTYTDDNSFAATLTVDDGDGGAPVTPVTASIANVAPTIDAGGNQTVQENDAVNFTATVADAGTSDTVTVSWDFGDGSAAGAGLTPTHNYGQNGSYTVTATATDDDGASSSDTLTITVTDRAPVVTLVISSGPVVEGSPVDITVTANDPGTPPDPLSFAFDMDDDGTFEILQSGNVAQHIFTNNTGGPFDVTVKAIDDVGSESGTATVSVVVNNDPPRNVGSTVNNAAIDEGDTVTFTGTFDDDGADTHTCTWDFGDTTIINIACSSGDTINHTYANEGAPTAILSVFDGDDTVADAVGTTVTVSNVAPSVSVGPNLTGNEGDTFSFTADFTDPGINDTHLCTFTFGDGTPAVGPIACTSPVTPVDHVYANEGVFTATIEVFDGLASTTENITVAVANLAPVAAVGTVTPTAAELAPVVLDLTFADPGVNDTHTCAVDFGDGNLQVLNPCNSNDTATHNWQQNGSYTVTLTVTDDGGASGTATTTVTITDVGPSIGVLANSGPINEGSPVTISAPTASDPSNDPLTFSFDFESDGTFDVTLTANSIEHTYTDGDSTHTVTVRVTDDSNNFAEATTDVDVTNVDPTVAAVGPQAAEEGELFQVTTSVTDPAGPDDPIVYSLTNEPAGMAISQTGTIGWVPTYSQSGRNPGDVTFTVTVNVNDGDGGTDSTAFTISSVWKDDDNDGMADTWEVANGLDPTVDDSAGDIDGDGVSNIDQFNQENGGPFFPEGNAPVGPLTGSEVNTVDVTFTTTQATDLDSANVFYIFEIYADSALTTLLFENSATPTPDSGAATTSQIVTVPTMVALVDNNTYFWRVRGTDMVLSGPWSPVESFFYNPVNDAPTAAALTSPLANAHVPSLTPDLFADNGTDADDTGLTMTFDIWQDAGATMLQETSGAIAEGAFGNTTYVVVTPLNDDTFYYWTVTVTDPHGLATTSPVQAFFVNLANNEPSSPGINSPFDGEELLTASPTLTVDNATDPEFAPLNYLFELDSSPTFGSASLQLSGPIAETATTTSWAPPTPLAENTVYYWRARASDGFTTGEFITGTFFVNVTNDPPNSPVAQSPANGTLVNADQVKFTVRNAVDPEGEGVTYDFHVYTDLALTQPFEEIIGVTETTDQTTWVPAKRYGPGKTYFWVAFAVDENNLSSAPGEIYIFETIDVGGGGCSCAIASGDGPQPRPVGALFVLVLALGALTIVRRRRR